MPKPRNAYAVHARQRKGGPMKDKRTPRGGNKNEQAELLDEVETEESEARPLSKRETRFIETIYDMLGVLRAHVAALSEQKRHGGGATIDVALDHARLQYDAARRVAADVIKEVAELDVE